MTDRSNYLSISLFLLSVMSANGAMSSPSEPPSMELLLFLADMHDEEELIDDPDALEALASLPLPTLDQDAKDDNEPTTTEDNENELQEQENSL